LVLVNRFIDFYKPDINEESKVLDNLRLFLIEDTFYERIKSVFKKVKEELQSIQKKRKLKFLSQERLAELCGLDRTYISLLERGKRNPAITNLSKVSKGLGCSLSKLVSGL
jgi:DNA-binding XRE family transcriptional regulator